VSGRLEEQTSHLRGDRLYASVLAAVRCQMIVTACGNDTEGLLQGDRLVIVGDLQIS